MICAFLAVGIFQNEFFHIVDANSSFPPSLLPIFYVNAEQRTSVDASLRHHELHPAENDLRSTQWWIWKKQRAKIISDRKCNNLHLELSYYISFDQCPRARPINNKNTINDFYLKFKLICFSFRRRSDCLVKCGNSVLGGGSIISIHHSSINYNSRYIACFSQLQPMSRCH